MLVLITSVSYANHDALLWNVADLTAMLTAVGLAILIVYLYKKVMKVSHNRHKWITFIVGTFLICFGAFSINNIHTAVKGQDTANATRKMATNESIIIPKEHKIMKHDNYTYTHLNQYKLALSRKKAKKVAINEFNKCSNQVMKQKHFDYQIEGDHAQPPRFHNYF